MGHLLEEASKLDPDKVSKEFDRLQMAVELRFVKMLEYR